MHLILFGSERNEGQPGNTLPGISPRIYICMKDKSMYACMYMATFWGSFACMTVGETWLCPVNPVLVQQVCQASCQPSIVYLWWTGALYFHWKMVICLYSPKKLMLSLYLYWGETEIQQTTYLTCIVCWILTYVDTHETSTPVKVMSMSITHNNFLMPL